MGVNLKNTSGPLPKNGLGKTLVNPEVVLPSKLKGSEGTTIAVNEVSPDS